MHPPQHSAQGFGSSPAPVGGPLRGATGLGAWPPYHGYWKNLALALTGRMDAHFTAMWDHGHIKFWSIATLGELLREAGFADLRFERVGRIPALAKSMIAVARRS